MQNGTGKVRFYHRVILNKPKNINSEKQYNGNQNQYTFGFCGQSFTLQRKQKPNSQYRQQAGDTATRNENRGKVTLSTRASCRTRDMTPRKQAGTGSQSEGKPLPTGQYQPR